VDRIIFREIAIKMPLSVALLFLPPSHPKQLAYRTHSLPAPIPVLGEVSLRQAARDTADGPRRRE
jgi:hypothetical protein